MRIEHFAVHVSDLEKMKDFYAKYFNAKAGEMYHNKSTGLRTYFLSFEDGARLEIMAKPNLQPGNLTEHLGYAHFAIKTGSKEIVDSLTVQLKNDGYKVLSEPRTTGDGYYESTIMDPEDNIVEITE